MCKDTTSERADPMRLGDKLSSSDWAAGGDGWGTQTQCNKTIEKHQVIRQETNCGGGVNL